MRVFSLGSTLFILGVMLISQPALASEFAANRDEAIDEVTELLEQLAGHTAQPVHPMSAIKSTRLLGCDVEKKKKPTNCTWAGLIGWADAEDDDVDIKRYDSLVCRFEVVLEGGMEKTMNAVSRLFGKQAGKKPPRFRVTVRERGFVAFVQSHAEGSGWTGAHCGGGSVISDRTE